MLTKTSRELILLTNKNEELDKKFKTYYIKSDKYIAEREAKVGELQEECNKTTLEYAKLEIKLSEENEKND